MKYMYKRFMKFINLIMTYIINELEELNSTLTD